MMWAGDLRILGPLNSLAQRQGPAPPTRTCPKLVTSSKNEELPRQEDQALFQPHYILQKEKKKPSITQNIF